MFAGMFNIAKPRHPGEIILLDFPANVIAEFLSLLVHPGPRAPRGDFWLLEGLRRLVSTYDCEELWDMVLVAYESACPREPFEYLVYALNSNDVPMARQALRLAAYPTDCRIIPNLASGQSFWQLVDRLRPSWRLALLKLLIPASDNRKLALHLIGFDADEFDPKGELEAARVDGTRAKIPPLWDRCRCLTISNGIESSAMAL